MSLRHSPERGPDGISQRSAPQKTCCTRDNCRDLAQLPSGTCFFARGLTPPKRSAASRQGDRRCGACLLGAAQCDAAEAGLRHPTSICCRLPVESMGSPVRSRQCQRHRHGVHAVIGENGKWPLNADEPLEGNEHLFPRLCQFGAPAFPDRQTRRRAVALFQHYEPSSADVVVFVDSVTSSLSKVEPCSTDDGRGARAWALEPMGCSIQLSARRSRFIDLMELLRSEMRHTHHPLSARVLQLRSWVRVCPTLCHARMRKLTRSSATSAWSARSHTLSACVNI